MNHFVHTCGQGCIKLSKYGNKYITNIFVQVIFTNIIAYLDRNFKEEQNEIILLFWCKFQFYLPSH